MESEKQNTYPQFKFLSVLIDVSLDGLDLDAVFDLLKKSTIAFEDIKYFDLLDMLAYEIYPFLKFMVEEGLADQFLEFKEAEFAYGFEESHELSRVIFKAESFLDKDEKISFYKKSYKKIYPKKDLMGEYLIYTKNGGAFQDWKQEFGYLLELWCEFIKIYLTCDVKHEHNKNRDNYWDKYFDVVIYFQNAIISSKELLEEEGFLPYLKSWRIVQYKKYQLDCIMSKINELEKKPSKLNFDNKTLKDFLNPNLHSDLMSKLIGKLIIDNDLKVLHQELKGWKKLRTVSCIGWLLEENHFFIKKINQTNLAVVLSNTFNVKLSSETLNAAIQKFKASSNINTDPHIDLLSFINDLKSY